MFKVSLLKNNKVFLEREFASKEEAEDFVHSGETADDDDYEYQIYDKDKNEIVEDGEKEGGNSIEEGTMNDMFPDEESKEGFDVDDHLGNN